MIVVKENELTKEMKSKLEEFAINHAKEVELVLAYSLKEQTEIKDNKLVWKAEIETHIQSIQEHLNNVENEILISMQEFDEEFVKIDWKIFKNKVREIFEKRKLL